MKHLKQINEFNSTHRQELLTNNEMFTVSYEIELEAINGYESFEDMKDEFIRLFPRFWNKWENDIDIIDDASLNASADGYDEPDLYRDESDIIKTMGSDISKYHDWDGSDDYKQDKNSLFKGLEIVPDTYFDSLLDGAKFFEDFYVEYKKQRLFKFTEKTGLHINLGYKEHKNNMNLLKGYLLLNEDYAFKGWEKRKGSNFTSSFRSKFDNSVSSFLKQYESYNDIIKDISGVESEINKQLYKTALSEDEKTIGFNIHKLNKGYIEFRYGGGSTVDPILIKNQTEYFANIVMACYNKEYRKRDYIRILTNYIHKQFTK